MEQGPEQGTTSGQGYQGMPAPQPLPPPVPHYLPAPQNGMPGNIRPTGVCILLTIVTLGIYTWFWYYGVHTEMQRRRQVGLGGGLALLLAIVFPIALIFITPAEVGSLYADSRRPQPVSGLTGLWLFLPVIGGLVWFIKTNGALNRYWEQVGVPRP
jgi:hypothetical protein